jgi:hypothetical protein
METGRLTGLAFAAVLATTGWCVPAPLTGQPLESDWRSSFSSTTVLRDHRYRVDARVRPLLFWISKSDIGDGRLTWRQGPDGTYGYELLVGSDPARTPRRINRWGYLREEAGPGGARALGVMSRSDERSVEEADKSTLQRGERDHVFTALQQHVVGSKARIGVHDVRVATDLTYTDLEKVLLAVTRTPSKVRVASVAGWNAGGFLAATASLIEGSRLTAAGKPSSAPRVRVYAYNGKLYDLQLQGTERVHRFERGGRRFGPGVRSRFRIRNRDTGRETSFTVVHGVDGELTDVPLFISFRPRWWLEIECVLADHRS